MAIRTEKDRVEKVIVDLLLSNSQLIIAGVPAMVDRTLLDLARFEGTRLLDDIRLGEVKVERWKPPSKDELQLLIGEDGEL